MTTLNYQPCALNNCTLIFHVIYGTHYSYGIHTFNNIYSVPIGGHYLVLSISIGADNYDVPYL